MHKHFLAAAGLLLVLANGTASPASASWGCLAKGPEVVVRNVDAPSRAAARRDALQYCGQDCRVVSCRRYVAIRSAAPRHR